MAYAKSSADKFAIDIIKTALQSGSIKLVGSTATMKSATDHAISDAAYLSKLLQDLSASLEKMGD